MDVYKFDPLKFVIEVGHIRVDRSVARITGDRSTEISLHKSEDDLVRSVARQCAEGSVLWNPNSWLYHYPEYAAIFTEFASMFNPVFFEDELLRFQSRCNEGTGLSYELYIRRFSAHVDGRLNDFRYRPALQRMYLEIAKTLDYVSCDEIQAMEKSFEEDGCCPLTGIDADFCPCGRHP